MSLRCYTGETRVRGCSEPLHAPRRGGRGFVMVSEIGRLSTLQARNQAQRRKETQTEVCVQDTRGRAVCGVGCPCHTQQKSRRRLGRAVQRHSYREGSRSARHTLVLTRRSACGAMGAVQCHTGFKLHTLASQGRGRSCALHSAAQYHTTRP